MPSQLVQLLLQQNPSAPMPTVLKAAEDEKDLESTDDGGNTALILACRSERPEVASILINKGANVNARNNSGSCPLIASSMKGQTELVKKLIDKGADVNFSTKTKDTALSLAMWKNHTDTALLLIEAGAFVDNVDQFGETTIIDACKNSNDRLLEVLLKKVTLSIDHQNNRGYTAVMFAAWKNSPNCLRKLLAHGANPNIPDHTGISPLSAAARSSNFLCCQILMEHGCEVDSEDEDGLPTLAYLMKEVNKAQAQARRDGGGASAEEGWKTLEMLISRAKIPHPAMGILLCSLIATGRSIGVTTLLTRPDLKDQLDLNWVNTDNHNRTAIMHLFEHLPIDHGIAKILLDNGADPDCVDSNGDSCLHGAVRLDDLAFARLLLEGGASPLLENKKKETPFAIAKRKNEVFQQSQASSGNPSAALTPMFSLISEFVNVSGKDEKNLWFAAASSGDKDGLENILFPNKQKESKEQASIAPAFPVDTQDKQGRTALMLAARSGSLDSVKFLLANKANVLLKDKEANNACNYAIKNKHSQIAELLLQQLEQNYKQQQLAAQQQINPQQQQFDQTSKLLLAISQKIESALNGH